MYSNPPASQRCHRMRNYNKMRSKPGFTIYHHAGSGLTPKQVNKCIDKHKKIADPRQQVAAKHPSPLQRCIQDTTEHFSQSSIFMSLPFFFLSENKANTTIMHYVHLRLTNFHIKRLKQWIHSEVRERERTVCDY